MELKLLPVAVAIVLPATFAISYILSAVLGHVYPLFPNISETGTLPPESCFFSLLLNISSALLAFAVYVRHKQIVEFFQVKQFNNPGYFGYKVNIIGSIVGYIACVGLDLVGNFQETNVRIVHDIGVLLCFWLGTLYIILQTLISFWMFPEMNSIWMVVLRGLLAVLAFVFVILNQTSREISEGLFKGNRTAIMKWNPKDPGWDWHVANSVSEWVLMVIIAVFVLSYYKDFSRIKLYAPEITITEEPHNNPMSPVPLRSFKNYGYLHS